MFVRTRRALYPFLGARTSSRVPPPHRANRERVPRERFARSDDSLTDDPADEREKREWPPLRGGMIEQRQRNRGGPLVAVLLVHGGALVEEDHDGPSGARLGPDDLVLERLVLEERAEEVPAERG
jgi:hypothetical protein